MREQMEAKMTTVRAINQAIKEASTRGRNLYVYGVNNAIGDAQLFWMRVFRARTQNGDLHVYAGFSGSWYRVTRLSTFDER